MLSRNVRYSRRETGIPPFLSASKNGRNIASPDGADQKRQEQTQHPECYPVARRVLRHVEPGALPVPGGHRAEDRSADDGGNDDHVGPPPVVSGSRPEISAARVRTLRFAPKPYRAQPRLSRRTSRASAPRPERSSASALTRRS